MSKLRLSLDALEVTSFEIVREGGETGTVHAHDSAAPEKTRLICGESFSVYQVCDCTGPTCDQTLALSCIPDNCI